jgi:hypothetical protein
MSVLDDPRASRRAAYAGRLTTATGGRLNCPFCAEPIQAAAIVCKHCGRDLQFLLLISRELSALRCLLNDLEERVDAFESHSGDSGPAGTLSARSWGGVTALLIVAPAVAAAAMGANFWWWEVAGAVDEMLLMLVYLAVAPATAFTLTLSGFRRRKLTGSILGLGGAVGYLLAESLQVGTSAEEVIAVSVIYVLSSLCSGVFGGWLGDRMIRRVESPFPLVRAISRRSREGGQRPGFIERLGRLAEATTPLVTALVPLALLLIKSAGDAAARSAP